MDLKKWLEASRGRESAAPAAKLKWCAACSHRVTTPLLPDDYLHLANPLWSARELRGQIVEVRKETADSATLVIKPGWGFDFKYRAGSVHRDRPPDRRALALAVVLAHLAAELEREAHLDHREGDARGVPVQRTSSAACRRARSCGSRPPRATSRCPSRRRRRSCSSPRAAASRPSSRCCARWTAANEIPDVIHVHSAPTAEDVMFADELADAARATTETSGRTCSSPAPAASSTLVLPRRGVPGLAGAADVGLRAAGRCSTRSSTLWQRRGHRGPAAPRAVRDRPLGRRPARAAPSPSPRPTARSRRRRRDHPARGG